MVQLLIAAGERLAGLMTPYMLDLFYLLALLEIVVIGINHMMGENNTESLIWGFVRIGFRAGFVWYWLQNAWTFGTTIIGSFDMLGSQITGIPHLDPVTLYNVGLQIGVWSGRPRQRAGLSATSASPPTRRLYGSRSSLCSR
jgi:hypothetical protein